MNEPTDDGLDKTEPRPAEDIERTFGDITELLDKHALIEHVVHQQAMPKHELVEALVHRQSLADLKNRLQAKLEDLHPADVARILEALAPPRRLLVWDLVKAERDGEILLEVSDSVRETLIASMDARELVAAAEQLDADELADLAPDLPRDVIQDVLESLDAQDRARLQSALSYPEESVGAAMDFEIVSVRPDISIETALRYLRRLGELPDHTDQLFVVDRDDYLLGGLPLNRMLVRDPDTNVGDIMEKEITRFKPTDEAADAASAFERYDFISAPVVDGFNRLVGRLTVDSMVDVIREESDSQMLGLAGLRDEEDLFSSVWKSAQNRWLWLAINLVTALIASRVIGVFEGSIEKLAALAALMPIVAGIGGNSGNQTTTLIVRGLALGHINLANAKKLLVKELAVSLLNGLFWGSILGVIAYLLYHSIPLGLVMTSAMTLNLLVAALMGTLLPLTMHRLGRDPAVGSSVLLTATTDSMGFFIFLGLATLFLI
ncbi:MAG: magnesium transporter [Burkholderiales bacterium]